MLKDGVWMNLTNQQKSLATSSKVNFFSKFAEKLEEASSTGGEVTYVDTVIDGQSVLQFLYEFVEVNGNLRGTRGVYLIEKLTGMPLQNDVYFLYEDGNEKLVNRTKYYIDFNLIPPIDDLRIIKVEIEKGVSKYQWLSSNNQQKDSNKSWPWYFIKYHVTFSPIQYLVAWFLIRRKAHI